MITIMVMVLAFAIGFYLGVLVMSLLAIGSKRELTEVRALDAAA